MTLSNGVGRIEFGARMLLVRLLALASRRGLVGQILLSQIAVAVVIGALALGGLSWASSWVIREQVRAWGEQWLDDLDEIATPLYVFDDVEKYARVDDYVDKFSEILFVRYYSESGEPIFTKITERGDRAIAPLKPSRLTALATAHSPGYVLDLGLGDLRVARIAKPIWAASVPGDGLLGFDSRTTGVDRTLTGYVELGLDFSAYLAYDVRATLLAAAIGAAILVLVTAASWLIYRRALLPLRTLRAPLQRLASGETHLLLDASEHHEILAITDAMRASAGALEQRNQRLDELASRDALTGLTNRLSFQALLAREVEHAAASGRTSALLFADLDQFKYINDAFSHAGGDRLLQLVADRLQTGVRSNDTIARFGGDEFAILLRDVSRRDAAAMCGALVELMAREPFAAAGGSLTLRWSIGATMIRGSKASAETLLTRADRACYQAKVNGRNQFAFYHVASKDIAERTADANWSQRIQKALKEDAFVLHYQPIVDLRTAETAYHEVLLRMLVDDDELASPPAFLPAAARMGHTVDIDRWVMRQSLRSLAALRAAHREARFTINVTGTTFDQTDFFDDLESELDATGVPLDAIVIEITEQIAMRNTAAASRRMTDLVESGCRFAIDDFGSGYCSYNYLKELPIAFVKIDGSFVANLADNAIDRKIVAAIADVAATAGCETIAEHVRDGTTLQILEELGVSYAQGYVLGKPAAQVVPAVWPAQLATARRRAPRQAAARRRTTRAVARAT